ncbi:MAG: hypothetical protein A2826_00685 [Candidatus Doudnabacteria bacterium RIFCSPHIGHO2_01_FULL_43_23]|uniref:Uncharacterized protein n=1 Tax=Candidatus Doudnabacteria bacterium RIFCSPHIGHO2_01_FULL_43_23 TaxID=1817822 RepID=A0A1F5NTR8_9BACT|nr:MAG: hypothetical protein A2826_00685 [Candidatus Doudnabacteria bacterium RIFCSPHIGHO2_01_FULL_43_23]
MSEKSREQRAKEEDKKDDKIKKIIEELRAAGHQFEILEDASEYIVQFDNREIRVTKVDTEPDIVSDQLRQAIEKSNKK